MTLETATLALVLAALAMPPLLLLALTLGALRGRGLPEPIVARLTASAMLTSASAFAAALALYLVGGAGPRLFTARRWFLAGEGALQFDILVDGWSLTFGLLAAVIIGLVGVFSFRYLHREAGFHRYFALFSVFTIGVYLVALAGSVEVLFAGWELLGLSSALLVAFFHERREPVRNAMRVFATYRVSDAAMLVAAAMLHHEVGSGSLSAIFLSGDASATAHIEPGTLTVIGLLLLIAVAGKSALLPFSSWLTRAMEGPTPSSAVFYGALSVHAGTFLLWRLGPVIEQSPLTQVLAASAGLGTAIYAAFVGRVQSDVKSALSYATLTQVGLIVFEIALGLHTLAFVHMVGNACLRLVQFLNAPNALADLSDLRPRTAAPDPTPRPGAEARHVFWLERGGVDALVDGLVVRPFLALARLGSRVDRWLAGEAREASPDRGPRGRGGRP